MVDHGSLALGELQADAERLDEQEDVGEENGGIDPQPLRKKIGDILDTLTREDVDTEELLSSGYRGAGGKTRTPVPALGADRKPAKSLPAAELAQLIQDLTDEMHDAARDLRFEEAARLRDEINELKRELREVG